MPQMTRARRQPVDARAALAKEWRLGAAGEQLSPAAAAAFAKLHAEAAAEIERTRWLSTDEAGVREAVLGLQPFAAGPKR